MAQMLDDLKKNIKFVREQVEDKDQEIEKAKKEVDEGL